MADKLNWISFRTLHKGLPKETQSAAWAAYKENDRETYVSQIEDLDFDIPEDIEAYFGVTISKVNITEESETEETGNADLFVEYRKLLNQLQKFSRVFPKEQIDEMEKRAAEIAKLTMPEKYKCTPTDGWQLWMSTTQQCVLVNTSRHYAFLCSRSWWNGNYATAAYVSRHLLDEPHQLSIIKDQYIVQNRLIKRAPLPGIEIMVPRSAAEYNLRG